MELNQAAGYLFESEIMDLLNYSGFVEVKTEKLEGRGTNHQIDAYGIYSIPVPFTYPIRLIAEAKCYEDSIELPLIRSFFGVVTDISENYFVKRGDRDLKERFSDTGCFFAVNSFTKPSQDFAWAHNIFLVSFSGIWHMDAIIQKIRVFLSTPEIQDSEHLSKEDLIINYQIWKNIEKPQDKIAQRENPSIVFGIIDNVYPVILVGNNGWHKRIQIPSDTDKVKGIKISRKSLTGIVLFEIDVYGWDKKIETVYFTLPNRIAKKITGRIDKTKPGKKVFDLDIPLVSWKEGQSVRRIITIEVDLPEVKRKRSPRTIKEDVKSEKEPEKILGRFTVEDIIRNQSKKS
jgi:hypothetical protein